MEKLIVSKDIFIKAAEEYLRRIGAKPESAVLYLYDTRNELEQLAEKINSLKTVGAI